MFLNYLKVPYETVWLSYPDIEPTLAGFGLAPSTPAPYDKQPAYTLPVIHHGERFVVGGQQIAICLSSTFPPTSSRPALFTQAFLLLARLVENYLTTSVRPQAVKLVLTQMPALLDDRGAASLRRLREKWFGMPLDEWHADLEQNRIWADVKKSFGLLAEILSDNRDGRFYLGRKRVTRTSWWSARSIGSITRRRNAGRN